MTDSIWCQSCERYHPAAQVDDDPILGCEEEWDQAQVEIRKPSEQFIRVLDQGTIDEINRMIADGTMPRRKIKLDPE